MGADAQIFVFDYERYRDEIVPAFLQLVCDGIVEPWVGEFIRSNDDGYGRNLSALPSLPNGFRNRCSLLDAELALAQPTGVPFQDYDGS